MCQRNYAKGYKKGEINKMSKHTYVSTGTLPLTSPLLSLTVSTYLPITSSQGGNGEQTSTKKETQDTLAGANHKWANIKNMES